MELQTPSYDLLDRLAFLASSNEATAQIDAGIQPISVNCRTTQSIPVRILPLKKNDNQGNKTAINIITQMY